MSAEASSSRYPEPSSLEQKLQHLDIQEPSTEIQVAPPASSKSLKSPLRPGYGTAGTPCTIKANHFYIELPNKDLHQYDVTITPEVTSRAVNRAIIDQLVELYRQSHLGALLPAYDGRKSLYTAGPLPFLSRDFEIRLVDEEGARRRERVYIVIIKFAARADLHRLGLFLQRQLEEAPQETLQVLDIVLRESLKSKYNSVGRFFYSPHLGPERGLQLADEHGQQLHIDLRRGHPIGYGLEAWKGFYQSIRPTQMGLSLNIDMSSTAFIKPVDVVQYVEELLDRNLTGRTLSNIDRVKIKKALKGVKVEVTHRGNMRRRYKIFGLTEQTTQDLTFLVDDRGTRKSVCQYFSETYAHNIRHTLLPCLQVGHPQRPNYLPMEVCNIVKGQRYTKKLNEKQITGLLKETCQRPKDRQEYITKIVRNNDYNDDLYANEFGIKINEQLTSVTARILPAPRLKYHDSGEQKDCFPQVGQWNMAKKRFINGGTVNHWMCINFSRSVGDGVIHGFCRRLVEVCQGLGMAFAHQPVLPPLTVYPEQVEEVLKRRFNDANAVISGSVTDLLIVILPDNNGPLYGKVKRICETELGLISQCCLQKNVLMGKDQYLGNLALKINVKVGGRNTILFDALHMRIPLVTDMPTIIFGADVTHPAPGEDSSSSIAAVVASQDWPQITKYAGLVSAQNHRQELIEDLYTRREDPNKGIIHGGMVRELLMSFRRASGYKPLRIIFYRDGVSEGQFSQVLLYELDAIRKACESLEPEYQPPVTFVVVQKRHNTRMFPNDHANTRSMDKSGNILPGTVVDTKICHPTQFDFYLCSHAGIQGTSRPAHYHVLWDENKFSADAMQSLTNNLCYTYARCTRAVSIVTPAYYAHLAAFRARFYMEPEISDANVDGRGGGRATRALVPGAGIRPLPALKESIKKVMFYC
ncbi:hypothetical protein ACFE04_007690 [Oxalis oulophora]